MVHNPKPGGNVNKGHTQFRRRTAKFRKRKYRRYTSRNW